MQINLPIYYCISHGLMNSSTFGYAQWFCYVRKFILSLFFCYVIHSNMMSWLFDWKNKIRPFQMEIQWDYMLMNWSSAIQFQILNKIFLHSAILCMFRQYILNTHAVSDKLPPTGQTALQIFLTKWDFLFFKLCNFINGKARRATAPEGGAMKS